MMRLLKHSNLPTIFGFSAAESFMVMELGARGSLYDVIQDSKYLEHPWSLKLSFALGVAEGLLYLHSQIPRIIHRDLKTQNVMIREDWSVFLVDFGISKEQKAVTTGTKLIGTPYCMAPEMFQPIPKTTPAIDVYGLGILLFELLTREIPQIPGNSLSGRRPEVPIEKTRGCPLGYVELMKACWRQDPMKRPALDGVISQISQMMDAESTKAVSVVEGVLLAMYDRNITLIVEEYLGFPLPADDESRNRDRKN